VDAVALLTTLVFFFLGALRLGALRLRPLGSSISVIIGVFVNELMQLPVQVTCHHVVICVIKSLAEHQCRVAIRLLNRQFEMEDLAHKQISFVVDSVAFKISFGNSISS
jgi:hypothetical protein